jgi:ABC-2 type transport system permease protein
MMNQIRAELFKLQRNKTFWVLQIVAFILSGLLHYLIIIDWWKVNDSVFVRAGLGELSGLSAFTTPLFFNLFVGTLAGFFISIEFSQSSVIKNQMMSGSKRSNIFLSKYLIFTLGAIVTTILIPLLTGIIEVFLLGHGEILNGTSLLYLSRAFGLYVLQFFGYTAIIILLAIVTEDSGKTIIFSILLTIVMYGIEMVPNLPILGTIYKNSIFYQFSEVFKFSMTNGEVTKSILIALLTFIIIFLCGIFVINKKEIK